VSTVERCLLVEFKLCNVINCIGDETGGAWEKTGVGVAAFPWPRPRTATEERWRKCSNVDAKRPAVINKIKPEAHGDSKQPPRQLADLHKIPTTAPTPRW